jgi:hypothetical protein
MPPEIIALIDEPRLLIAVLLVGVFAGMTVERFLSKLRRQAWREKEPLALGEEAQWGQRCWRTVAREA